MGIYNGLSALFILLLLQGCHSAVTFPKDSEDNSKQYVRSMEIIDSGEKETYSESNPDRRLQDDDMWEWETSKRKKYPAHDPDEKTISFQVLDEDPYHHGRPAWPHDEYILGYVPLNYRDRERNSTADTDNVIDSGSSLTDEASRYYEWQKLQGRPSPSAFIGPGFYDISSSSSYDSSAVAPEYYRYQPSYQAITTEGSGKVQTTAPGGGESVPGTPSESNTNTRHFAPYQPYDLYKRKRLRLQIHPGLIAAPLAGLAAFGAASALTSKPLLVELGYVRNKPELNGVGGWGWAGNLGSGFRPYPPFYPPPNPPPGLPGFGIGSGAIAPGIGHGIGPGIGHGIGIGPGIGHGLEGGAHAVAGGPQYPILRPPVRSRPDGQRSSWWNPFSSLTPRLLIE